MAAMPEPLIVTISGHAPQLHSQSWVAPNASLIGQVSLAAQASVWYSATLRAEVEPIEIGYGSNIQDGVTIHVDAGFPARVGSGVSVGHNAVLHGCTVEDDALIGMGSIVMNGAHIRRGSVVGAGSIITEGKDFPEYSLIIGAPARMVRTLDPAQVEKMGIAARAYVAKGPRYTKGLKKIG